MAQTSTAQLADENNLILLNAGAIDTSTPAAEALRASVGAATGKQMRLIQFVGPIRPEWYAALVQTGARVVTYIPNNAYLVYGSAKELRAVQTLAAQRTLVQWDGPYSSLQRLAPTITAKPAGKDNGAAAKSGATKGGASKSGATKDGAAASRALPNLSAKGNELFAIQLVADREENAITLALIQKLQLEPVMRQARVLNYVNIVVALPRAAVVDQLAARGDVVSIQPWSMPHKMDERQDMIIAGNLSGTGPATGDYLAYLASHGFSFNTASFGVNISDSGVDNGTPTPNHFGLYALGNPTSAANSRLVYTRVVGTPTGPAAPRRRATGTAI